jgi:stage IV sporulation protein FB
MKVEFHYTYIIIAISFILTGYFSNLLIFTSIIIIHELGHYLIAKLNSLNPEKITIYPFGGITRLNIPINTKISKELMIALSGVIFQSIYYLLILFLYKNNIIRTYIFEIFKNYHYSILFFNLLPIHPLDGSKIINLIMSKYLPYKLTLKLTIVISIITAIIIIKINYYKFNYTTILIITIIVDNLIKYSKNINYYFNKFLLERYLYKYHFSKSKNINKIDNMYKEKYHIIKENSHYLTEKEYLKRRFKGNY